MINEESMSKKFLELLIRYFDLKDDSALYEFFNLKLNDKQSRKISRK